MLKQELRILFKETDEELSIRHFRNAPAEYQQKILCNYIAEGRMSVLAEICGDSPQVFKSFIDLLKVQGDSEYLVEAISMNMKKVFEQFMYKNQDKLFRNIVLGLLDLDIGQLQIACCIKFGYQSKYYAAVASHQGLNQVSTLQHPGMRSRRCLSQSVWETKLGLAECDLNVAYVPTSSDSLKNQAASFIRPEHKHDTTNQSVWGSMLGLVTTPSG